MALTAFQRDVCRLLAEQRKRSGESYVAGGVALNELTQGTRLSRDIDLFHDTAEALRASWDGDRLLLEQTGHTVEVVRERPTFVEALVRRGQDQVVLEWSQDSAYRFFPLVEHSELGLTLHPVDLATNKVLALVGRHEVRDFIDVVRCDEVLQPLGYLAWAAAGKDPGFSPRSILEEAGRSVRYPQVEIDALAFEGRRPDATALGQRWRAMLAEARLVIDLLPPGNAGTCVLTSQGDLFREPSSALRASLAGGRVVFHPGTLRGSFPAVSSG